jgi:hypothetical protein
MVLPVLDPYGNWVTERQMLEVFVSFRENSHPVLGLRLASGVTLRLLIYLLNQPLDYVITIRLSILASL